MSKFKKIHPVIKVLTLGQGWMDEQTDLHISAFRWVI